jgi:membrane-associated phospholipid phosphatase
MTARWTALAFLLVAIVCVFCILFVDAPAAVLFADAGRGLRIHRFRIGTPYLLPPIAALVLVPLISALRGRNASRLGETLVITAYSALAGAALNGLALKRLFGRSSVNDLLMRDTSYFHFLHGNVGSSFPSGHAVIAGSIVTTLWIFYPRLYLVYLAAGMGLAALLMLGKWHFLSDIIAGFALGCAVALTTRILWKSGKDAPASS